MMKILNTIDENFVRENFKDPAVAEAIIAHHRKRSIVIKAVVLSLIIVSILALGYAYVKQSDRMAAQISAMEVKEQLLLCTQEAEKQMLLASEAQRQANEKHELIQRQLIACEAKSKKK